ncbi:MAG: Holliday junction branch migration protein RuvA, partial [Phycisphaerales bacterium]
MITRLAGMLETVEGHAATVRPWLGAGAGLATSGPGGGGADLAIEVLVPGYFARELSVLCGQRVVFHTLTYLEGQGQGSSFIPRLLGFATAQDRAFFELFTTVNGIGNRKALRALAEKPSVIAAAIMRRDAKALEKLPEIGKRMAEKVVVELHGKVDAYAAVEHSGTGGSLNGDGGLLPRGGIESSSLPPAVRDAIDALVNLGETRADAERKVARTLE